MLIEKLEQKFDFNLATEATLKIVDEHQSLSQIGLTHSVRELSEDEKITESIGSLVDPITNVRRFEETDFSVFNEKYKDTYLYEMYKSIPHVGRFRIMVMDGPKCYTFHKDFTKRYHYVIQTNSACLFLFPALGRQMHIPADGNLYIVDTLNRHTFINGSRDRRIHLVFDDLSSLK